MTNECKCPFCKQELSYKDILFYISQDIANDNEEDEVAEFEDNGDSDFLSSLGIGSNTGTSSAVKKEKNRENTKLGTWIKDKVYLDERKRYLGIDKHPEQRFIVQWTDDPEEFTSGTAMVGEWHDAQKKDYPIAVTLCEEDQAKSGYKNSLLRTICPHCHFEVSAQYWSVPKENCHSIALIGYPSCGKTQYKVTLLKELSKLRTDYRLVKRVEIFSDVCKSVKGEAGEEDGKVGTIATTDPKGLVLPMVFALKTHDNRQYLITLYDVAGEIYADNPSFNAKLKDNTGIQESDGAILMIEASQLYADAKNQIVHELGTEVSDKVARDSCVRDNTDITAPLELMEDFHIGSNLNYLALTITKTDLLFSGKCGPYFKDVYLRQNTVAHSRELDNWISEENKGEGEGHFETVKPLIINRVDQEVMSIIDGVKKYSSRNIKKEICDSFYGNSLKPENIRAFAISTLRRVSPDDPTNTDFAISNNQDLPLHRIMEPMLYLMARWGIVPIKETGGGWGAGTLNGSKHPAGKTPPVVEPDEPKSSGGFFRRLFGRH